MLKGKWRVLVLMVGLLPSSTQADWSLAVVQHHWIAKIVESNYVTLRPGSVYDMRTYFEQNFGFWQPQFNYLFNDTGLGTADPIYPIFQKGYQQSWWQLIPAFFDKKNRHIDHYSELPTPEGCVVKAAYWVRHIDDFPELYQEERAQGYELVDIGFDYFEKTRPDAECGRHRSHNPDPRFDPIKAIKKYAKKFRTPADIPADLLNKYEFKIGLLKLVKEEFGQKNHPRFKQLYSPAANSLWYYKDGIAPHYGMTKERPQPTLEHLKTPGQLIFYADEILQSQLPLDSLVPTESYEKYLNFLNGEPVADYDLSTEPGQDGLDLNQVSSKNFYSRGLQVIPMHNVQSDVSDPRLYKLVAMIVRPYEEAADHHWDGEVAVPQVRFVYQLMDSQSPDKPVEQLYVHLSFDAVDRYASELDRMVQHKSFLARLDHLIGEREAGRLNSSALLDFVQHETQQGLQALSFSSSMTGIWVFGMLSKSFSPSGELEALRIVREGVDLGYYSTAWDNQVFRDEARRSSKTKRDKLLSLVEDVTPQTYRDSRRMDARTINFNRMSCAQCHQMSGRDAVHVAFNDHIDRRIKDPVRVSEFLYHELDRQLEDGPWHHLKWEILNQVKN